MKYVGMILRIVVGLWLLLGLLMAAVGEMAVVEVDFSGSVSIPGTDTTSVSESARQAAYGFQFWQAYPAVLCMFVAIGFLFRRSLFRWAFIPLIAGGLMMLWLHQDASTFFSDSMNVDESFSSGNSRTGRASASTEISVQNDGPEVTAYFFYFFSVLLMLGLHGFYKKFLPLPAAPSAGVPPPDGDGAATTGAPSPSAAGTAQDSKMSPKSIANIVMGVVVLGILAYTFIMNQ